MMSDFRGEGRSKKTRLYKVKIGLSGGGGVKNDSKKSDIIYERSQRPKTSSAKAKRQPLHVALRQSASKHGSRAVRAEKIKEQAHFNAVKDFQVFF